MATCNNLGRFDLIHTFPREITDMVNLLSFFSCVEVCI
jgi:hypothetical protein